MKKIKIELSLFEILLFRFLKDRGEHGINVFWAITEELYPETKDKDISLYINHKMGSLTEK
jgi:hypothetical protein